MICIGNKRAIAGVIAAMVLVIVSVQAEEKAAPTKEQIQNWVKQLGSEKFDERVEASNKLREAGVAAEEALQGAVKSDDPEVKNQASQLLGAVQTQPILDKIAKSGEKVKSFESDMAMTMSQMGMNQKITGKLKAVVEPMKMAMTMNMNVMGNNVKAKAVMNEKAMFTEMDMPTPQGQKKIVMKMSAELIKKMGGIGNQAPNPVQQMEEMKKIFDFIKVEDGKIGEVPVHILHGKIKEGALEEKVAEIQKLNPMGAQAAQQSLNSYKHIKMSVGKEDGMMYGMKILDGGLKSVMDMKLTNVKINPTFEDNIFEYTPPEGAQVMDMEKLMKGEVPQGN